MLSRKTANTLIGLWRDGYLRTSGWLRSVREQRCVDEGGRPIPWMTYPALAFLEPRLSRELRIFEFGSGASTRWWATRVEKVISCEHDAGWYQQVSKDLPSNVTLLHVDLADGAYARTVAGYGATFDVVVIDGRDRLECARHSLGALNERGVIVWDNSDRAEADEGYALFRQDGFRRIDFFGMGPLNPYGWCTSIFYRSNNCFGI